MCRFRDVKEATTVKGWVQTKIQINKTLLNGSSQTLSNMWWLRMSVSAGSVVLSWEERTWRCWTRKRREEDWWQSLATWYDAARYISMKACSRSVCGCLHMTLKKNGCIMLVWLSQIFKKRTWWVKVLAHIVLTVLIFIHVALSFYEMFFNWTKMFFFRSSRKLKEESKDHLRYEKFNIQTHARIIGALCTKKPSQPWSDTNVTVAAMGLAELPSCVPTCEPVASRSQKFLKFKSSLTLKRLCSSSSELQNCGGAPHHQVWDQAPTRWTGLHHCG